MDAPGELVEHLFRRQAGRMTAALVRIFGPQYLQLAEDVVQEALVRALEQWPHRGVPENPAAWLIEGSRKPRARCAAPRGVAGREGRRAGARVLVRRHVAGR